MFYNININEKINFGIKFGFIYKKFKYYELNLFNQDIFNYNNLLYKDDNIFDSLYNINKYNELLNKINNNNIKLKKVYIQYPTISLKRNCSLNNNKWTFKNIYNNYFCFCKGKNCLNIEIQQKCKYYMYINIIDNNRNIYKKLTIFLLILYFLICLQMIHILFFKKWKKKIFQFII